MACLSAGATACSTNGQFFDPMGLQCLDCPAGASVTADGLGCACAANTYWVSGDGTSPYGGTPGAIVGYNTLNGTNYGGTDGPLPPGARAAFEIANDGWQAVTKANKRRRGS